jgi:hypothetical protein
LPMSSSLLALVLTDLCVFLRVEGPPTSMTLFMPSGSNLVTFDWLLVAVLTVQFVPHRKHTPSP